MNRQTSPPRVTYVLVGKMDEMDEINQGNTWPWEEGQARKSKTEKCI